MKLKISFAILDCFTDALFPSLLIPGLMDQSAATFAVFIHPLLVKLRSHFTSNINQPEPSVKR